MLLYSSIVLLSATFATASLNSTAIERAYIITLSPGADASALGRRGIDHINDFHKRASPLDYTTRHTYEDSDAFLGLSIRVNGGGTEEDIIAQLQAIPEVAQVSKVQLLGVPVLPDLPAPLDPFLSFKNPPALKAPAATGNLLSALQMGNVDKLHALGIKGKGIKIGVIDTGIDYRHPALGAGFGPGKKIAGGYSFVTDNGTLSNSPDPLITCYGGGHGTHVAGIIGMDSVAGGFDIVGVAPEASIYAYRVFDCTSQGGSDTVLAAMLKAKEDGVDLVSMSLGLGVESWNGEVDPLATATKALTDAGIAVIAANANNGVGNKFAGQLYTVESPGADPRAIGVGAVANSNFPLVYSATDSSGTKINYASIYPLNFTDGADVFVLDSGCNSDNWLSALASIEDVNRTIIAFESSSNCPATGAGNWNSSPVKPVIIMAFNANSSDPYQSEYTAPSPGFYGPIQVINLNAVDGAAFANNYASAGGYKKYKLFFKSSSFTSPPQVSGGLVDYYSSFGPTWHEYGLKPQFVAPGGHILATWPLGVLGGYAILSGTSMATPYISGSYALVKSKNPSATWDQIRNLLQTNSVSLPWAYDKSILSSTAQQGAGLTNVYDAIFSNSTVSPGQLTIKDVTHTEYGTANLTIKNTSKNPKTYTLSHQGAGYMNYRLQFMEVSQQANYGSANFSQSKLTIQGGQTATVKLAVTPPKNVVPSNLPVFGGFIQIKDAEGEQFSVPYIGPPYSQYNTPYIFVGVAADGFPLPRITGNSADGPGTVDIDFLEIKSSLGYSSVVGTSEWTQEFRADLLPANTNITANHYGFNKTFTWDYIPSAIKPKTTIFGFESFGNLVNQTGFIWPGSYGPSVTDTSVTGPDGVKYEVGNGDYRILASVLRWGGAKGNKADYDIWLGPVIRFVS